jgi:hypothetical protein
MLARTVPNHFSHLTTVVNDSQACARSACVSTSERMILLTYRRGLRVSELGVRRGEPVDLKPGRLRVRRRKNRGVSHLSWPD